MAKTTEGKLDKKRFSMAMRVVRGAARNNDGKLKSRPLAMHTGQLLAAVRNGDYIEANMIASAIIKFQTTGKF